MIKKYTYRFGVYVFYFTLTSCINGDNYTSVSPVVLDFGSLPYPSLSQYHFFEGNIAELKPVYGVLPYKIISGLFIDYAKAKTFVWMPKGKSATYVNDYSIFDFPDGTVLITTHYFENVLPKKETKLIETRLIIKNEGEWTLVNYVWNTEQTEATYTKEGSVVGVRWLENNETRTVNYSIPSYDECFACHNKYEVIKPIGPKPQNINHNLAYKEGTKNQLEQWVEIGYLDPNYSKNIVSAVNWEDASQPLELRARSYLDINCAHCHSDKGYCNYPPMRFSFNKTKDPKFLGVNIQHGFNLGDSLTNIVSPGNTETSALLFRMRSTLGQFKMPIIGRSLQHKEGVQLIEQWIRSLDTSPVKDQLSANRITKSL